MPPKARRKGSGRKPLTVTNGASKQNNTIDDYFPPSPIENNNEPSDFGDAITYCNGTTLQQSSEHLVKNGVVDIPKSLPTPEDSPEKLQPSIKDEPTTNNLVIDNYQTSIKSHSDSSPPCASSSNTSSNGSAVENILPGDPNKTKSKRSKKPKVKKEEPKVNRTLTEFFPVRKSARKTAKELQREQEEIWRNKILDCCEEGLQIVNYEEKGRGIQAMRDFSKGDFIVEYAGDLVELSEAKSREEIYKKDTSYGCYMYFFNHKGKSYCVDATSESGKMGRLLNHSRLKPNCVTKTIDIGDLAHLILIAARDIQVGEELLYDYGDRSKQAVENNPWLKE